MTRKTTSEYMGGELVATGPFLYMTWEDQKRSEVIVDAPIAYLLPEGDKSLKQMMRLFAASPDLLAICKKMLRGSGKASDPYQCNIHLTADEMEQLCSAIAKAEGKL